MRKVKDKTVSFKSYETTVEKCKKKGIDLPRALQKYIEKLADDEICETCGRPFHRKKTG